MDRTRIAAVACLVALLAGCASGTRGTDARVSPLDRC
jgi:hypothetical protein